MTPLKSVISDGSLMWARGAGVLGNGKWWTRIPRGVAPPGMGFGSRVLLWAFPTPGMHNPEVKASPAAPAVRCRNPRRPRFSTGLWNRRKWSATRLSINDCHARYFIALSLSRPLSGLLGVLDGSSIYLSFPLE